MEGVDLDLIPADVLAHIERNRIVVEDEFNDHRKRSSEHFFSTVAKIDKDLDNGFAFYVDLYGHVDATIRELLRSEMAT